MLNMDTMRAIGMMVARQAREKAALDTTPANEIIDMAVLLKPWKEGKWAAKDVCVHDALPYWCVMAHDSTGNPTWSPAYETALWAIYHGRDAAHALPFKAEGHNPYMIGHYCLENGKAYRCKQDNTVHAPSVLPSAWEAA